MSRVDLRVRAGDRVLIVGPTGSGKSTVASSIANAARRVLVIDPKLDDRVAELPNAAICYGVAATLRAWPGRVVYRPLPDELADLPRAIEPLMRAVLFTGACTVVFHETEVVAPSTGARGWTRAVIMWGRSRGITMLFCAQRPARIDRLCLSEPAAVYLFGLRDARDLSVISGVMGANPDALRPLPAEHAFYYRGPNGEVYPMAPLKVRPR